jgi:predicted O-methyltransferase YrrM
VLFLKKYLFAAASCLYLFSFGFILSKNRPLISTICKYFGYKPFPTLVPQVSLTDVIPDSSPVQLLEITGQDGNVSLTELAAIAKIVARQKPEQVLEIGTFDGRTTLNIAANCDECSTIYTLDLPRKEIFNTALSIGLFDKRYIDKEKSGDRFIGTPYEKRIVQLYGDSATFDFSPYFDKIDAIFIDGSHSYEYVLNDSRVALKLLKNRRGLIIWHDYNEWAWEGVVRALNELYTQVPEFKGLRHIEETTLAYAIFQ